MMFLRVRAIPLFLSAFSCTINALPVAAEAGPHMTSGRAAIVSWTATLIGVVCYAVVRVLLHVFRKICLLRDALVRLL